MADAGPSREAVPSPYDLAASRCAIYVTDVERRIGLELPARYTPSRWWQNKFSAELWLRRAAERHPWRVSDPAAADLIFIGANFSMYCAAGKTFTGRSVWSGVAPLLGQAPPSAQCTRSRDKPGVDCGPLRGLRNSTVGVTTLTNNECKAPWTGGQPPKKMLFISDQRPGGYGVLAPFVVSHPPWLAAAPGSDRAALGAPLVPPWHDRLDRLVFYAGHVPKLYIEPTRYLIWAQVQAVPGVTAISHTLNCSVGAFSACRNVSALSDAQLATYCHPYCQGRGRCKSRSSLRRYCKSYARVDYSPSALAGMARSAARRLSQPEYYREAMGHKFCLTAPGDFVSTPKMTEFVALGAAGGCLPLLVVKGDPRQTLPHTSWLDWCSIAYLVNHSTAISHFGRVLTSLRAVSREEAATKRAALERVANAFVWRPPDPTDPIARPSAADILLGEACAAAKRFRAREARPERLDLRRCML